jgi:hypothetical protein
MMAIHVFPHPGGHYLKGDVLNSWQLKNGKIIEGNFSFGDNSYVVLEQKEGKMIKILISDLSIQDQKLANFKISRIERLKEENLPTNTNLSQENYNNHFKVNIVLYLLIFILIYININLFKKAENLGRRVRIIQFGSAFLIIAFIACKKNSDTIFSLSKTRTSFIDSAFAPYKPSISTSWDENYFYIASKGIPFHNMMVGITNWQQQVPIPQFYTGSNSWSIPLQPIYSSNPLSTKSNLMKGAIAIAVDGIPIFNALNNRGEDSYQIGELDNWGGHCGKADDYHYHAAPLHLAQTANQPIAFALDGFPVYGNKEPDGTTLQSLDSCHGHLGSDGLYHYHGTTTYPYVIGAMRGKVTLDPTTTAPENQIIPQAYPSPLRPSTNPLNGAKIIAFTNTDSNAYKLTYQMGLKLGYVEYNWNNANLYTYKLTDTGGVTTIANYQR